MSLKLGLRNKIRRSRAGGFTGLLDQSFASGATAAYSLRRLKSSATKAVRVREDSGNTEADIGFSGGALDETALLNHVGSNNGFVTKWYDQSGNSNDASNSTASEQPQIVISGSVIKENGRPAIQFDGSDDYFTSSFSSEISQPNTIFSVIQNSGEYVYDGISGTKRHAFLDKGGSYAMRAGSFISGGTFSLNQILATTLYNTTSSELFVNGSSIVTGDVGSHNLGGLTIGNIYTIGTNWASGNFQEIIVYNSNQSSNKGSIESNINNYYNIY